MRYLFIILLLSLIFRLYGLNWDQNNHLHPDERMITLVTLKVHLPKTENEINNLFTPDSSLNPNFFAYGSFPVYLLGAIGSLTRFNSYDQLPVIGRILSALFDCGTIITIYFIGKKIFGKQVGILGSFFYTVAVLPIQLSHFYAVDTLLTFFISLSLLFLIRFYERPNILNILGTALCIGLSLATKTSALLLAVPIGSTLLIDFLLTFVKQPHKIRHWLPHLPKTLTRLIFQGGLIVSLSILIFFAAEPFALIDFSTFLQQTKEQSAMTKDAFVFPYTLQYVGKIPYLYELKNIFYWGLGPLLASLAFLGTIYITIAVINGEIKNKKENQSYSPKSIIVLSFYWIYFFIVGSFAIGFMRYMLPIYPLLCLFAATFFYHLYLYLKSKIHSLPSSSLAITLLTLLLIWPISFLHIYSEPTTRVQASDWINAHIPTGRTLAIEHWDDGLPLRTQPFYQTLTLPMYDPDTASKWAKVSSILEQTQYIIVASNRLYVPLQKLTDCNKLPVGRCYEQTARYYQQLFDGSLGFKQIAQFQIIPQFPIPGILPAIDDFTADESFTVYDHPKVMIFEKIK